MNHSDETSQVQTVPIGQFKDMLKSFRHQAVAGAGAVGARLVFELRKVYRPGECCVRVSIRDTENVMQPVVTYLRDEPASLSAFDEIGRSLLSSPLPGELRDWARAQHTDEEVIAALKEARQQGTFELKDFIEDLEKVVKDHGPAAV